MIFNHTICTLWIFQTTFSSVGQQTVNAMQVEEDSLRATLLCCNDNTAFSVLTSSLNTNANVKYDDCKCMLSGDDYKQTLQLILRSMKFEKGIKITSIIPHLKRIIPAVCDLAEKEAIKFLAVNQVSTST